MADAIATQEQLNQRLETLQQVRARFRESLANPLRQALLHRSPLASAQIAWSIPMECVSAGFKLEMHQDDSGWHLLLARAIDDDSALEVAGEARSLLKAMFQLSDAVEQRLDSLESACRHQITALDAVAQTAA